MRNVENNTIRAIYPAFGQSGENGLHGGGRFVCASSVDNLILYDSKSDALLLKTQSAVVATGKRVCAVSNDGRWLAEEWIDKNDVLVLWDVSSGTRAKTLHTLPPVSETPIEAPVFSPDGTYLYARDQLWNIRLGTRIPLDIGNASLRSVVFQPDSRQLAARVFTPDSLRGNLAIFDCDSGKKVASFASAENSRYAFTPDGSYLIAAESADRVLLRNAHTGEVVHTIPPPPTRYFWPDPSGAPLGATDVYYLDEPLSNRISSSGNEMLLGVHDMTVWHRRRPENRGGIIYLWQFWMTFVLGGAVVYSIVRDRTRL